MKRSQRSLDELGIVSRGRSRHRPRDAAFLYGGPYPFIQTGDVKHADLYIRNYSQTYSEAGLAQSKLWRVGTLCITIAANIGYTAILAFDSCFPDSIIGFIADPKKADTRFVKYLFDALLQKRFQRFTQGAAQDNLSEAKLLSQKFLVPDDVTEQAAIADVLAAYDALIENNLRRIHLLEEAARMLYREWFMYLRFPGHEHVKVMNGVPDQWECQHLSRVVTTQYGYTETATEEPVGPKFLRGTDINKTSYIDWDAVPYCSDKNLNFEQYALAPNDIVVIRMADPGKVGIIEREIKAVFASYLVRFRLNQGTGITPLYLFSVLSGPLYQGFISGASEKSTRKSASAPLLTNFTFLKPPGPLQDLFVDSVSVWRRQMNVLLQQNAALRQARDLLLPRLISGQITV